MGLDRGWYSWWRTAFEEAAVGNIAVAWDALATASYHQQRSGGPAGEPDLLLVPAFVHARARDFHRSAQLIAAVRAHQVPTMTFTTTCVYRFVRRELLDGIALPKPDRDQTAADLLRQELQHPPVVY